MADIRKWFIKQHDKGNAAATPQPDKPAVGGQESSERRKTSKYFTGDKQKPKTVNETEETLGKRKIQKGNAELSSEVKPSPAKKPCKKLEDDDDDDDDFVNPSKKLKNSSGKGVAKKSADNDESDEDKSAVKSSAKSAGRGRGGKVTAVKKMEIDDEDDDETDKKVAKSGGRGLGGRGGGSAAPAGGRGRGGGGGRGGFMFGERKDPPHKGEKEVPEGSPECLSGLTFVISGTLDSLEREEAEDLVKRHGGRVTGSVSKKTNFLLCDEDIGGKKSETAKKLGTTFLTEDGLFEKIRASSKSKVTSQEESKKAVEKYVSPLPKASPQKSETKKDHPGATTSTATKKGASPAKRKNQAKDTAWLSWTEKYKPKVPSEIIGNQSMVKQLHDWLVSWNDQFLNTGSNSKGKKQNASAGKKAVLLSGSPGIGKTTSAMLVSQMLGYVTVEVNASDSRGKANSNIDKGIGGSVANSVKELVSNEALSLKMDRPKKSKTVLIMDEVDGMSAGDRGGVADLIASIKMSKIPIICICNDRYSQKLKSLVNYCLLLNFRKPTKQQMGKRLQDIANAEGLEVNLIAMEELSQRVNGDMRMAVNQLQYMSLSMQVIKYDDIRLRLLSGSKDEDISPFTAVDKLFSFEGGKLRMDERMDASMSDMDLVPLIVQENYLNYRPSAAGKDEHGIVRMNLIARAAESIGDGDIFNVQIRRHRQWQLSQNSVLSSCIIPAALLHGGRERFEQWEQNYNRFGGWLGKNSTMNKSYRLLEDLNVHVQASRGSYLGRTTLRLDFLSVFLKNLTDPLRSLPKDEAVEKVVEFMDTYSISQEDFDSIVDMSKFQGHPNPMDGIQAAAKGALTKAYNKGSSSRVVRTADQINVPGIKKTLKKRVQAILEPNENYDNEGAIADPSAENEEENNSDAEDIEGGDEEGKRAQMDLKSLNSKGIQVQLELKSDAKTNAKKGRGRGSAAAEKKPSAAPKRKR